jgi:chitosanase
MVTRVQEMSIKAIVNIFETGSVLGDYSCITLIPGDTGQLTYGRSQTTLTSGGLYLLVDGYCENPDALFPTALSPYLPALESVDPELNASVYFHNLLRAAADDPVMREEQDRFFDQHYWNPAAAEAENTGIETPLGLAVVYDSTVHGSWRYIKRRTTTAIGTVHQAGERRWVQEYVSQRYDWLSHHRRKDLRATTYRMETFKKLMDNGEWLLELPQVIRGVEISEDTLTARPPHVYDGPAAGSRDIMLTRPLTRGLDVRLVQVALSKPGNDLPVKADGIFGRLSGIAVKTWQEKTGLQKTGVVDQAVFAALEL